MALPKQIRPVFTLTIPSTDEQVKYNPFTVKHEKSLLIAQESGDTNTIIDTIKAVISDCIISNIDINKLAVFDLEYIASQIRAKSVGEISELIFLCDDCETPKARVKVAFDLTKLNIEKNPAHSKKIDLFDNVGVMMKYPTLDIVRKIDSTVDLPISDLFDIIADTIEYVYDGNEVYYTKEQTKEEVLEFIDNLTKPQLSKIKEFYTTMPKLRQYVNYRCPVCSKEHKKYIEGIESFLF